MYIGKASKTISFNGSDYAEAQLTTAIATAPVLTLDSKMAFHDLAFDQALIPQEWKDKYKIPVLTVHEGRYVYIVKPDNLKVTNSMAIRFVSKFAFNKARIVDVPTVDVQAPICESNRMDERRPFNPPRFANTPPSYNTKASTNVPYKAKPKSY